MRLFNRGTQPVRDFRFNDELYTIYDNQITEVPDDVGRAILERFPHLQPLHEGAEILTKNIDGNEKQEVEVLPLKGTKILGRQRHYATAQKKSDDG